MKGGGVGLEVDLRELEKGRDRLVAHRAAIGHREAREGRRPGSGVVAAGRVGVARRTALRGRLPSSGAAKLITHDHVQRPERAKAGGGRAHDPEESKGSDRKSLHDAFPEPVRVSI